MIAALDLQKKNLPILIFLIATVLTLLSNIEKTFNSVLSGEENPPMLRRLSGYFSVVTLGPGFVVLGISLTSTMKSPPLFVSLL